MTNNELILCRQSPLMHLCVIWRIILSWDLTLWVLLVGEHCHIQYAPYDMHTVCVDICCDYIGGLVQDCSNSIASALELLQSCPIAYLSVESCDTSCSSSFIFQPNTWTRYIQCNRILTNNAYPGQCIHILCWRPPEKALPYLAGIIIVVRVAPLGLG